MTRVLEPQGRGVLSSKRGWRGRKVDPDAAWGDIAQRQIFCQGRWMRGTRGSSTLGGGFHLGGNQLD